MLETAYKNEQGNFVVPVAIDGGTSWAAFEIVPSRGPVPLGIKSLAARSFRFQVEEDLARYAKKKKWDRVEVEKSQLFPCKKKKKALVVL
jgi:hypothetical protein